MSNKTDCVIEKQSIIVVGVKYVFELQSDEVKYNVKVIPNKIANQDFDKIKRSCS